MSNEENKNKARRFILEHNQAGYNKTFDELLVPDCVFHEYLPGVPQSMDRAAYSQFIGSFRSSIPDIHNTVEEVFGEDDKVAVRWKGYGTHTGTDLMGIPAGNKEVRANGIYIFRFSSGKIAEIWSNWDNLNVMKQMG